MITQALHDAVLRIDDPRESYDCYFDVNGQTVRVATPDSETIASLRSFFDPYIPYQDQAENFYDLVAIVDGELYSCIKTNLPATPDARFTTSLQHDHEYQLKSYDSESGEITIIEDEPLKLFYLVFKQNRATRVIATEESRIRTGLLRIIRAAWVLGHDALILHGCVLQKNGNGIVVSGEKFAGKTTSLFNLCVRKGYDIVANDRLLLECSPSGASLTAKGVPTVVKLRLNTVKPFRELQHLIDVPLFGVSDLARELTVEVRRETAITAIAFLFYDAILRDPVFRKLSAEEGYEILATHLFSWSEYEWVRLLNIGEPATGRADESKTDILKRVSCFQLSSNETQLDKVAVLLDRWCQKGEGVLVRERIE